MTTQTILSDSELIVKGYNAIIADAQYEFEDIKEEVLLQLEDLDEDFDTYREFELRLEAYENGAFDPDIEKILGIGGRKAGTWNPRSEQAKLNRAKGREKKYGGTGVEDSARIKDAEAATRYRQAGQIHPSQFKGARPGGKPKGAGGGYKGGENVSERDSFAGAIARKLVGGKRGAAKKKGEAAQAVKDKASQGSKTLTDAKQAVGAGVGEVVSRGKDIKNIATTAARSSKDVALTGKVQPKISSPPKSRQQALDPAQVKPGKVESAVKAQASQPQAQPTYSPTGKRLFYGADGQVTKSFTDRLRKSMGYNPRHIRDRSEIEGLPW
jgi:hypothetical protein